MTAVILSVIDFWWEVALSCAPSVVSCKRSFERYLDKRPTRGRAFCLERSPRVGRLRFGGLLGCSATTACGFLLLLLFARFADESLTGQADLVAFDREDLYQHLVA
jgi:hypothetical protein